jgi:tetratricopeptide (TPR) repeat protein
MKSLKVFIIIIALTLSSLSVANVSELYEDAIQSYNNDDIDTAYIHLKNALNESPSHLPSKILMGKVLVYKGFLLDALIEFEEAQQANGDPNLIILPLANTHLLLEQFDEVVALSNDGLSPSNTADLYLVQGNAFLNLGQNDQAIKQYKSALAISPKDIGVLTNIAYFYLIHRTKKR